METVKVYHNPRCSTSRNALQFLKEKKIPYETIEYLKDVPTEKDLKELLKKLGLNAEELVRKKETLYKEVYADKKLSEAEWIKILFQNPVLIERPIIVKGNKAVIGRPTEKIEELL